MSIAHATTGPVTAVAGPFPCLVCEAPVWRVPAGDLDWAWADADGRWMADRGRFRWRWTTTGERVPWLVNQTPMARLAELSRKTVLTADETHEYTALRHWECYAPSSLHTHYARDTTPNTEPPPKHCGWSMYAAPRGWVCRRCPEGRG